MRWFGEDPVTYTNWEAGSSDLPLMDTCVALHSVAGTWEKVSCIDDVENGVVCEAAQSKIQIFWVFFSIL